MSGLLGRQCSEESEGGSVAEPSAMDPSRGRDAKTQVRTFLPMAWSTPPQAPGKYPPICKMLPLPVCAGCCLDHSDAQDSDGTQFKDAAADLVSAGSRRCGCDGGTGERQDAPWVMAIPCAHDCTFFVQFFLDSQIEPPLISSDPASLLLQGCDTFTISPSVAMKMFMVESTLDYFADFEAAARRNGAYEG